MSISKRLRIKLPSQHVPEDVCSLEEAQYRFNWGHEQFVIVVEGRVISTYEELKALADQEPFRDKEYLEVELAPILMGG
jgi:hypothetical protein